MKDLEITKILI